MPATKPICQKGNPPIWSRRIASVMKERGITGNQLAKAIGTTPQTLSYILSGRPNGKYQPLKADHLQKICECLGVSSDYILGMSQTVSTNPMAQSLGKATGLTEAAIDNLLRIAKENSPSSIYDAHDEGTYAFGFSLEGDDSMAATTSLILEDHSLLTLIHEYMVELPDESRGVFADIIGAAILGQITNRIENIRMNYQKENRELLERRTDPNELGSLNVQQIGIKVEAPEGLEIRVIQNEKLYAQLWSKLEESLNEDSAQKGGPCD